MSKDGLVTPAGLSWQRGKGRLCARTRLPELSFSGDNYEFATHTFLDARDAVKRRKKANQIYRDLAAERISHELAALELQALNKRQKGGWLKHRLGEILYPLRAREASVES